jgi:hypothetical protein
MTTAELTSTLTTRPRRLLVTMRDELRERRRVRASYRDLERSLSVYSTPSEVDDLLAAIAHQDGPDAQRVRRILARNMQHQATNRLAS